MPESPVTPALRRRLAAFTYEGVLLFGLVMAVGALYSVSTGQKHALYGRHGMMAAQFLALASYFLWFWTHGGQTLAMKTWHLRLLSQQGGPVSLRQALGRFLLSWLWFMPPWVAAWLAGWHQSKLLYGGMAVWMLIYAMLTRLTTGQQFLHDVICGTRLVDTRQP
jgi:uncharacterized RDD family membrane protein YckC